MIHEHMQRALYTSQHTHMHARDHVQTIECDVQSNFIGNRVYLCINTCPLYSTRTCTLHEMVNIHSQFTCTLYGWSVYLCGACECEFNRSTMTIAMKIRIGQVKQIVKQLSEQCATVTRCLYAVIGDEPMNNRAIQTVLFECV